MYKEEETLPTNKYKKFYPMLQLCFIIDATGSMDPYVSILRNCFTTLFKLFEKYQLTDRAEIGIVAYRDFCQEDPTFINEMKQNNGEQWQPQPKTEFIDFVQFTAEQGSIGGKLHDYLNDLVLRCEAGEDYAEDIAGGFAKMLELSWLEPSIKTTRIAILITDAPCHGKQFHDNAVDYFSDLTLKPEADIRPQIDKMIAKNINLTIIEINKKTNTMIKEIQQFYTLRDKYFMFQALKLVENLDELQNIQNIDTEKLSMLTIQLLEKLEITMKIVKSL